MFTTVKVIKLKRYIQQLYIQECKYYLKLCIIPKIFDYKYNDL